MRFQVPGAALLLLGLMQGLSGATITNGVFDIAGTIYVTDASGVTTPAGSCAAGTQCIFWVDPTGTLLGKADISSTGLPNGNIPASIAGNAAGNIDTLTNPPEVVGTFAAQPFFSFNNGGVTTVLDINQILPGLYSNTNCNTNTATATTGETCTPTGSLFSFVNNPPPSPAGTNCNVTSGGTTTLECQATATWAFQGITNDSNATWVANFTSQFSSGTPYQSVLAQLGTQHFVSNTYSATITLSQPVTTQSTPEPSSWELLLGGAFVAVGAGLRRSRARRVV